MKQLYVLGLIIGYLFIPFFLYGLVIQSTAVMAVSLMAGGVGAWMSLVFKNVLEDADEL